MIASFRSSFRALALALLALAAASACRTFGGAGATSPVAPDSMAVRRDIEYLASVALQGRETGTPGNDSAAAYIARRYAALGLEPLSAGYLQHFVARPPSAAHAGQPVQLPTQNVTALLRGRDPSLRGEYIVIGAHFDHLGHMTEGALDPDAVGVVRRGADDNASGTAAVLELARLLASNPPRRSVIFANFSGEELGLLGSSYWVEHSPVPLDSVDAMLNFDMVGRLRDRKLIILGASTASEFRGILDSANVTPASPASAFALAMPSGDGYGPSDQSSFFGKDIPVLHFFTDVHEDYHRASDVPERINAAGEAEVLGLALTVARRIADRPSRVTLVKSAGPPPSISAPAEGAQPYLGSVPDMGASDVTGVKLSGVRAGSPAEKAGMLSGDVVVELGGATVKDLQSYSDALYSHKPGDEVKVVVLRQGKRVDLIVTLGRRGG